MQRISNPRTLLLVLALFVALAVISHLLENPEAEEPDVATEIAAHTVFTLGPLEVTTTVVYTWAMIFLIGVAVILVGRSFRLRPGPVQNALEWLVEAIEGLIRETVGVKDTTIFLPIVGTLAVFIGTANLIGLIPGLKSPTPDINTPLSMALVVFFSVPYFGIRSRELFRSPFGCSATSWAKRSLSASCLSWSRALCRCR